MKLREVMNRYPMTLPEGADFALARQMMVWAGIRHIPIVDGDRLVGILSERDILRSLASDGDPNPEVSVAMRTDVQTASPEDSVLEVAARMAEHKIGCLPVTERGALIGLVTTGDILDAEVRRAMNPRESLTAGDLCDRTPLSIAADDRLLDAAGRMQSRGVRHLPVVDGTRRVVGILSDRDIRAAVGDPTSAGEPGARARFDALRVKDHMTRDPITAHPDDSLASVARTFVDHRLSALPVIDRDERLIGMITYLDILRATV